LIFRVENQWVTQWGVRVNDVDLTDPPVVLWAEEATDKGWRAVFDRFSLACLEIVLSESMLGNATSASRELDDGAVGVLERRFDRLAVPDFRYGRTQMAHPCGGSATARCCCATTAGPGCGCMPEPSTRLTGARAVLPGDCQTVD
jgi:hypothetical protein